MKLLSEAYGRLRAMAATSAGQGMVEYALIIALVAVVLIVALTVMSNQVSSTFSSIANAL